MIPTIWKFLPTYSCGVGNNLEAQQLSEAVRVASERLAAADVPTPAIDAELLLAHVLGATRGDLQASTLRGEVLAPADSVAYQQLVTRRAERVPLQHLTGKAPFRYAELAVGPGVFIPRPETETVVQFAIDALRGAATTNPIGIDLGTGSGAIAHAMATEVPRSNIYAAELSPDAFAWASRNLSALPNVTLVQADLAGAFAELAGTVDVLISNPPYIPNEAIPRDLEVRLHDPALALYGGEDGLDFVRTISERGMLLLRPGGTLVLEHGELQGAAIRGILTAAGYAKPQTHPDLTGRDRATTALRPASAL
jgi:release factor glutamine methyltransferase